jgi:hypothetical protein
MNSDEFSLFNKIILNNFKYDPETAANEVEAIKSCQRHFVEALELYMEDPNSELLHLYCEKYFKQNFNELILDILNKYNDYRMKHTELYQTRFDNKRLVSSLFIMYSLSMYSEKSLINKFLLSDLQNSEYLVTGYPSDIKYDDLEIHTTTNPSPWFIYDFNRMCSVLDIPRKFFNRESGNEHILNINLYSNVYKLFIKNRIIIQAPKVTPEFLNKNEIKNGSHLGFDLE